jgi:CheY-like chemotaxis protein
VQADAVAKDIRFSLNFDGSRPQVMGDPVRLQQIFWNILKNAVKFTPEGGAIAVVVRAERPAGPVLITIADNGIGLTAEELPRIFGTFSQGQHANDGGSHRFGGLGLGLAISRTLAELHSGTIRALSGGRDQGATFVVELPLAAAAEPAPAAEAATAARAGTAAPGRERCILLVEDHAPTRTVLSQMLRSRGYQVLAAGSLAEARTCANGGQRVDLLISDIGLPDGTGYELMAELSAHRPLKGIALTGYGMEHDLADSRAAGFVAHLTKPVGIQMIDEAMAELFREGAS